MIISFLLENWKKEALKKWKNSTVPSLIVQNNVRSIFITGIKQICQGNFYSYQLIFLLKFTGKSAA